MHHFSFVLSIDSADPDRVLLSILEEVIAAITDGQFRDQYLETDHTGSWRFWEGGSGRDPE
jgi:hypothetical protein